MNIELVAILAASTVLGTVMGTTMSFVYAQMTNWLHEKTVKKVLVNTALEDLIECLSRSEILDNSLETYSEVAKRYTIWRNSVSRNRNFDWYHESIYQLDNSFFERNRFEDIDFTETKNKLLIISDGMTRQRINLRSFVIYSTIGVTAGLIAALIFLYWAGYQW